MGAQRSRICLQCRSHRRRGFDPWVGKIPWRSAWQPTPVWLPGESPWTEEPGVLQSIGPQRVRQDWHTGARNLKVLAWEDAPGFCSPDSVCLGVAPWLSWGPKSGDQSSRLAMASLFHVVRVLGPVLCWGDSARGHWWGSAPPCVYSYSRANLYSISIVVLMVRRAAAFLNKLPTTC